MRPLLFAAFLTLAACATTAPDAPKAAIAGPAFNQQTSERGFAETLAALKNAAQTRGFTIFAEIDHAANAAGVGAKLPPSTLVIFGNPKGGTPLIAAAPTIGADLPLRALVYQAADGKVVIATQDIERLLETHGIVALAEPKAKLAQAVAAIAAEAAAAP